MSKFTRDLKEYLVDYASDKTRAAGEALVSRTIADIPTENRRAETVARLERIAFGEHDLYF